MSSKSDTNPRLGEKVDAEPARLPGRATLRGRLVTLEPLSTAAHGEHLFRGAGEESRANLWLYLFEGPFDSRSGFDTHLNQLEASEDRLFFAIVDNTSGNAQGYAAYMRIEPAHRVIEVGSILYSPQLQRTAGATEAMYLMARYAFEELGYRRYEWKCNALNAPSRRAAARLGFTFEGTFRQHMIMKGRNRDTAWYSMLDCEWPDRKARFERWLDPSNFDSEGRQLHSLSSMNAET
jgi:RimJ/RimL family protein N-acetyltransferase